MTRRESREQAFILIFEKLFNPDLSVAEIVENALLSESNMPDSFAQELCEKVYSELEQIDANISRFTRSWSTSRISKVSLAVLRLAVCEMLYYDDIPAKVSINEAVELAKLYGADNDASFVNGLLGSLSRAKSESTAE